MILTVSAPIYVQTEGVREGEPVALETLLYHQQQLDNGDALLVAMDAISTNGYTHRLYSETGGVFHVCVEEGTVQFPEVTLPASLAAVEAMAEGIRETRLLVSRLYMAVSLLQGRLDTLAGR